MTGEEYNQESGNRLHVQAYKELRRACRHHIDSRAGPTLRLCVGYKLGKATHAWLTLRETVVRRLQEESQQAVNALAESFADGDELFERFRLGSPNFIYDSEG